ALRRLEQAAHRRAARADGAGLHARLAAALRERQAKAAGRPGLRLQGPARGGATHGRRPARRQDRRAPLEFGDVKIGTKRELHYSALMPASFTTLPHVSYSRWM